MENKEEREDLREPASEAVPEETFLEVVEELLIQKNTEEDPQTAGEDSAEPSAEATEAEPEAQDQSSSDSEAEQKPQAGKKRNGKILLISLAAVVAAAALAGFLFVDQILGLIGRAEFEGDPNATVDSALLGNLEETGAVLTTGTQETTVPETEETGAAATETSVTETTVPETSVPETTVPATTVPETTVPETTEPVPVRDPLINVLVVGQAYREGEESRMSDTIMLVTINKDTKEVTLTSFFRDTYLDMPDYMGHVCGHNRINVVYHLGWTWGGTAGAMEMMNLCLKNNFGIEVDYNVEVDFRAFAKVIDVLGGVRITLTEEEARYMNNEPSNWQEVVPGENRLYGDAALVYARMRKATGDGDSDIKRTARQRTLVTAILEKVRHRGMDGILEVATEVLPLVVTNMTNEQIMSCILQVVPILPDMTISTGTCPVKGTYWGELIELGGYEASVLKFDWYKNRQLMMAITEPPVETEPNS